MATPATPAEAIPDSAAGMFVRDDDEGLFSRDSSGLLIREDDPSESDYEKVVTVQIDGHTVRVPLARPLTDANGNLVLDINDRTTPRYTTIYDAARTLYEHDAPSSPNFPIPTLCHVEHMKPVAVCRLCVVQIYGQKRGKRAAERKLLPACQHHVKEGMEVFTMNDPGKDGERVRETVKMMTEMLSADHLKPAPLPPKLSEELSSYNELGLMSQRCGADVTRFQLDVFSDPAPPAKELAGRRTMDDSSPVFNVDHSACILCERCIRGCGEVKGNFIIGRTGKGAQAGISFDLNDRMADSGCVQCGECMISCPTSAITFKPVAEVKHMVHTHAREVLPTRELLSDPVFTGIPPKFLLWQQGLVVRRRFRAGEVLCHQGEAGNTAFIMKSGRLRAEVYPPVTHKNEGLLGSFTPRHRPKPLLQVELGPENLIFGEMSCLSGLPRSADVIALEDGEVWELRRNVLDRLMRLPSQRERIEAEYKDRALSLVLRSAALFKDLPERDHHEILDYLRERLSFVRVNPGQAIIRQGERATSFYIARLGYIRISLSRHGNEARVLTAGPGSILGEISLLGLSSKDSHLTVDQAEEHLMGLFRKAGDDLSDALPAGIQTATCTALDNVELARLNRSDFLTMVHRFPIIRKRLVAQTLQRLRSDSELTPLLNDYIEQGLYEARSVLVLDLDLCTRCDDCTGAACISTAPRPTACRSRACCATAASSPTTWWRPRAAPAPRPHCMAGCPVDSIHRGKHLQIVIEDHCIGCGLCASNCPYGSIFIIPNESGARQITSPNKAANCDLCDSKGVLDSPDPSCVRACPHDAAHRMTGEELFAKVLQKSFQGGK